MRQEFRREILGVLGLYQYPATTSTIKRLLDQRRAQPCGRETIRKYLRELADDHLVVRQPLPHQRGRKPLVVYTGRPAQTGSGGEFLESFSTD